MIICAHMYVCTYVCKLCFKNQSHLKLNENLVNFSSKNITFTNKSIMELNPWSKPHFLYLNSHILRVCVCIKPLNIYIKYNDVYLPNHDTHTHKHTLKSSINLSQISVMPLYSTIAMHNKWWDFDDDNASMML